MRRRLLLADDSVTIQRVIELTFADEDIDVVAVGDGGAAMTRLGENPPPDVVLADVGMPAPDGYDLALHVHQTPALAHIPVVLLIGALQPLDEARAKEAACAGVLVKPFEPNLVIAKVREVLKRADQPAQDTVASPPEAGASSGEPEATPGGTPSPQPGRGESVDEYFARLDAAFASLETRDGEAAAPQRAEEPEAEVASASPAERPGATDSTHAVESPRAEGVSMGDAFAALLALEQGAEPGRLPDDWPAPLTAIVEEVAQRIAEQVTERVVRALAPEIVTRVAERIVREEIERLRQELGPAQPRS